MLQFFANGICMGSIIAIVALGFGLIYTTTRVFRTDHAGIYALTGYMLWVARASWKLPLAVAILISLAVAALGGILMESAIYQPLARRSASTAIVMISSLGVQIVLQNTLALGFGNQTKLLRTGIENVKFWVHHAQRQLVARTYVRAA